MLHKDRKPRVSVIIPCYNHGRYVVDTIASIDQIKDKNLYEIIVVNDGSTDGHTNRVLSELASTGLYNIITQPNQGVCKARNTALQHVRGEYILPVDSDNQITEEYVPRALEILDNNPDISIVYTDSELFGEDKGLRIAGPYNMQRLMLDNYIDNCSVFRTAMIRHIGNYDTFPSIVGAEDWELWLRAAFHGYKFHYINEPLFRYRILSGSLAHKLNASKIKGSKNIDHFIEKFPEHFGAQHVEHYFLSKFRASPVGFLGKIILKLYFPKRFARLVQQGKLRKYI